MPGHHPPGDVARGERRLRRRPGYRWALLLPAGLVVVAVMVTLVTARPAPGPAAATGPSGPTTPSCPRARTPLVLASAPETAAELSRLATSFAGTDAGRCTAVTVVPEDSDTVVAALADGWPATVGPRPDVWVPSGPLWLPMLQAALAARGRPAMIPDETPVPTFASSPVVIAMPRPMALALGWPEKPIGWADLAKLSAAPTGWASVGHPEWGRFSLGKGHPRLSPAALEGTIATYYAAVGRGSGLTPADVADPAVREYVTTMEQAVARYGDTASFLTDWAQADQAGTALDFASAAVVEEYLVTSYNQGDPTGAPSPARPLPKPQVPLVAIYPAEGTMVADRPYAVLQAAWVTPDRQAAAAGFLAYLRTPEVQQAWQALGFRDAARRPDPQRGVADGILPDEPKDVLPPPPAAVTSAVLAAWNDLRKPANALALVDTSASTAAPAGDGGTTLQAVVRALGAALPTLTGRDELGLWSFAGDPTGHSPPYAEQVPIGPMTGSVGNRSRRAALTAALAGLRPGGGSGLYDSLTAAYHAVLARYRDDRINAVVVVTDGSADAGQGPVLADLLQVLTADPTKRIRVFTIAYGPDADRAALQAIARATGGSAYVASSPAELTRACAAAAAQL